MSGKIDKIAGELADIVKGAKKKTAAFDTPATVTRIEDGTAWVHIPGGVDETPVKLTINAEAGDTVQVRVSGGRAWLTGNGTAPPTDDTTAVYARTVATEAQTVAEDAKDTAGAAARTAGEASKIATTTNQYFWHHNETGSTENGAHVTQTPQEDFLADPTNGGGNTLITSNGVAVRDGTAELATFSGDGIRLGESGKQRIELSDNDFEMFDADSVRIMHIDGDGATATLTRTITTEDHPSEYTIPHTLDSGTAIKVKASTTVPGDDDYSFSESFTAGTAANAVRLLNDVQLATRYDGASTFRVSAANEEYVIGLDSIEATYAGPSPSFVFGAEDSSHLHLTQDAFSEYGSDGSKYFEIGENTTASVWWKETPEVTLTSSGYTFAFEDYDDAPPEGAPILVGFKTYDRAYGTSGTTYVEREGTALFRGVGATEGLQAMLGTLNIGYEGSTQELTFSFSEGSAPVIHFVKWATSVDTEPMMTFGDRTSGTFDQGPVGGPFSVSIGESNTVLGAHSLGVGQSVSTTNDNALVVGLNNAPLADNDLLAVGYGADGPFTVFKVKNNGLVYALGTTGQEVGIHATRPDAARDIGFIVGSGGNNRGFYDAEQGGWVLYENTSNNVILQAPGGSTVTINDRLIAANMANGTVSVGSVAANSYKDTSVSFGKTMAGAPTVVCSIQSTSTAGAIGSLTASAINATTTGFTLRVFNAGTAARSPGVAWIAMY